MSETTQISSLQPNLRFGTSFLDTKYRDHAANGEVLMDKSTGEVVLKRKEDGSLIYYDRESQDLEDLITEVSALMKSNVEFTRPSKNNREYTKNIYFTSVMTQLDEFEKEFANIEEGYSYGVRYMNNSTKSSTMSRDENGFFINLVARPRDASVIDFLAFIHNSYIQTYTGEEAEILEMKSLYETNESYRNCTAEIEYTIEAINNNLQPIKSVTRTAYIRINSTELVPFFSDFLNPDEYNYLTLRINSVRLPKIKYALDFVNSSEYHNIYESLVDGLDTYIKLTHMYVSFFTDVDSNTVVSDPINSRATFMTPLDVFEDMCEKLSNISSAGGITVNPEVPDDLTLSRIEVWVERIREVKNKGETKNVLEDPETSIEALEYLFGEIESIQTFFTTNMSEREGLWLKTLIKSEVNALPW